MNVVGINQRKKEEGSKIILAAWILAFISTLGSLFFSEVMDFVPCTLCWYERICMYPLAVLLLLGLTPFDENVFKYSLPFVIIGWLFSLYHNLVQWHIIPESASPCVQGIPCSTMYIQWLGFITIPFMAFVSFTLLGAMLFIFYRRIYK